MQNVIGSSVFVRLLHGDQVTGLSNDANSRGVTPKVEANPAQFRFRIVVAFGAKPDARLYSLERFCEQIHLVVRQAHNVEGESLCAFRSDAWKFFKFANEQR